MMKMKLLALTLMLSAFVRADHNQCNPRVVSLESRNLIQAAYDFQRAIQDKANFVVLNYEINRLVEDSSRLANQASNSWNCFGLGREFREVSGDFRQLEDRFYYILSTVNGPRPGLVARMNNISAYFQRIAREFSARR